MARVSHSYLVLHLRDPSLSPFGDDDGGHGIFFEGVYEIVAFSLVSIFGGSRRSGVTSDTKFRNYFRQALGTRRGAGD